MKLTTKQLSQLQSLDAILCDSNLGLRLVSYDDYLCCLQLHRIDKNDRRTYDISSIQLYTIDRNEYIKSYSTVNKCFIDLNIFLDLFFFTKLKITK